jgi:hypothetical protein
VFSCALTRCYLLWLAAGQGENAGKFDDKEQPRLRQQTLDRLRSPKLRQLTF